MAVEVYCLKSPHLTHLAVAAVTLVVYFFADAVVVRQDKLKPPKQRCCDAALFCSVYSALLYFVLGAGTMLLVVHAVGGIVAHWLGSHIT